MQRKMRGRKKKQVVDGMRRVVLDAGNLRWDLQEHEANESDRDALGAASSQSTSNIQDIDATHPALGLRSKTVSG